MNRSLSEGETCHFLSIKWLVHPNCIVSKLLYSFCHFCNSAAPVLIHIHCTEKSCISFAKAFVDDTRDRIRRVIPTLSDCIAQCTKMSVILTLKYCKNAIEKTVNMLTHIKRSNQMFHVILQQNAVNCIVFRSKNNKSTKICQKL